MPSAEASLDTFLDRYAPEIATGARRALAKLERAYPGAHRLVYDNYNALVITFGTSPEPSGIVFSIALYPRWVTLFFLRGAGLADPKKLLRGSGKTIRSVVLASEATLDDPAVRALVAQVATPAMRAKERGELVIQSISPKQRPRRPDAPKAKPKPKKALTSAPRRR